MPLPTTEQRAVCTEHGVDPAPPAVAENVGVALATMGGDPVNGLRVPLDGASGWFFYGGTEPRGDVNFYQPICVSHFAARFPQYVKFLALPPGWRVLCGRGGYLDVWFDEDLLAPA